MPRPSKQSDLTLHTVFVYGTLRPGLDATHRVRGFLYDMGWYPALVLDSTGELIALEKIEVNDEQLADLDMYEGYDKYHPSKSLYIRKKVTCQDEEGWIYLYNHHIADRNLKLIRCGDWKEYNKKEFA